LGSSRHDGYANLCDDKNVLNLPTTRGLLGSRHDDKDEHTI